MYPRFRSIGLFSAGICSFALLFVGCSKDKKVQPVPVGELVEYRDPGVRMAIKYPKNWVVNAEVGRVRFYNALDVNKKFIDPTGAYPFGVEIALDAIRTPDAKAEVKKARDEMVAQNIQVGVEQKVTINGREAAKLPFVANYGGKNIIRGHHVYLSTDSVLYDMRFAGFGDNYAAYAAVFDAAMNTFEPPKPIEKGKDQTLPSETFAEYAGTMFTFQYPENFNFSNPPKGKDELVLGLRGVRLDCNIQFDVFGAQGLSVEKVFEQNKGKYKGAVSDKGSVAGLPAPYLTYLAARDVERRVYFVVRNDKVIRLTLDWYKPQRSEYLAAYDKVVGSIKFK